MTDHLSARAELLDEITRWEARALTVKGALARTAVQFMLDVARERLATLDAEMIERGERSDD